MKKNKNQKKEITDLEKIDYKKLHFTHDKLEADNLRDMVIDYPSFKNVFKTTKNYTIEIIQNIKKRLSGKIKQNFILNISGLSGTGKTTAGILIGIDVFPNFDVNKHLAFSNEELLDKAEQYSERGAVFVRDEISRTLRFRSQIEVEQLIETNREQQLCFILIGVPEDIVSSTHYALESVDWDENSEVNRFALKHTKTHKYRGAFLIALPKNKQHKFYTEWNKYMKRKVSFQQKVRNRMVERFDPTEKAREFTQTENYKICFKLNTKGNIQLNKGKLQVELFKKYSSLTNEERRMISTEINLLYEQSMLSMDAINHTKKKNKKIKNK